MNRILDFYRTAYVTKQVNYAADISLAEMKDRLTRIFSNESPFPDKYNIKLVFIADNKFVVGPLVEFGPIQINNIYKSKIGCSGTLTGDDGTSNLSLTVATSLSFKLGLALTILFLLVFIAFCIATNDWQGVFTVFGIMVLTVTWFIYTAKIQQDEIIEGISKAMVLLNKLD